MASSGPPFRSSGFAVLRTPLLPWEVLAALGSELEAPQAAPGAELQRALASDRRRVARRLRELLGDATVREAVLLASTSLARALEAWLRDERDPRGLGAVDTLYRYVARMAGRATPFGLLAGWAPLEVAAHTSIALGPRAAGKRVTHLDNALLTAACAAVRADPAVRADLVYRPSTALHRTAGQLRLATGRVSPATGARSYRLVGVEPMPELDHLLARAADGATRAELVASLADLGEDDAASLVDAAIEAQILVDDLDATVVGEPPLAGVLRRTRALGAAALLARAARDLTALDARGLGAPADAYAELAGELARFGVAASPDRLFHVDLEKATDAATLGPEPMRALAEAAALLARVGRWTTSPELAAFVTAFVDRWGEGRRVGLAFALDDEAGVGFGVASDPSPFLAGLPFAETGPSAPALDARTQHLLRGVLAAVERREDEWVLTAGDVDALASSEARLPDAFALVATLAGRSSEAVDAGELRVVARFLNGPSGAAYLARFCHDSDALAAHVRDHLRAEEALRPDCVFAEIVHLPEGRDGNVAFRPLLRDHVIPYLGITDAAPDACIGIEDLDVSVEDGRVRLWSRRLDREVVPRMTCAHDADRSSLGIYRFLVAVAGRRRCTFDWGGLGELPRLPRVRSGRVVLSPARWSIAASELPRADADDAAAAEAIRALRERRQLPRWVALDDGDQALPLDLDNVVAVDALRGLARGRPRLTLSEVLPEEELVVVDRDGRRFVHDLVVPFVKTADATPPSRVVAARPDAGVERAFPPGSRWLHARIATGTAGADAVLEDVVAPLVRDARRRGLAESWFFVRYDRPRWHLRVRFRGEPKALAAKLLPRLHDRLAPMLANGRVSSIDLGTYEREVERYGGPDGIVLAEAIFEADSDAALAICAAYRRDPDARFRLALRGVHALLSDLGFDLAARTRVVAAARDRLAIEHRAGVELEAALGARFREERRAFEALLAGEAPDALQDGLDALQARSEALLPVAGELRARAAAGKLTRSLEDVAIALAHMHVNRVLRGSHRKQELVLLDALHRLYVSEAARARRGGATSAKRTT